MKKSKNNTHIEESPLSTEEPDTPLPVKEDASVSSPAGNPGKPRKRPEYLSLVKQISLIRRSIESSLSDPDILKYVAKHGYDTAEFQVGLELVNEVEALYVRQGDMLINKKAATRKKNDLGIAAEKTLSRFIKTARLAFENDPEILITFRYPVRFRHNYPVWLEMGKVFYATVLSLPEAIERFEKYQVSRQDLEEGRQKLIEVETQSETQFSVSADSQVATDRVVLAYSKLLSWWSEYRKISRIAFKNDPQLLEKLGIAVPTRKSTGNI